jgi:hypothetical protein
MSDYADLIKSVFANAAGEELLDVWQRMYGDRMSYVPPMESDEVAYREGERNYFLHIKQIVEQQDG